MIEQRLDDYLDTLHDMELDESQYSGNGQVHNGVPTKVILRDHSGTKSVMFEILSTVPEPIWSVVEIANDQHPHDVPVASNCYELNQWMAVVGQLAEQKHQSRMKRELRLALERADAYPATVWFES